MMAKSARTASRPRQYDRAMELAGQVVVVTGGASGIGRALARRVAAEGAAGVVVADRDAVGARRVADELGDAGLAVACDVADPDHAQELIAAAARFGPVDLFCANAGVAVGRELGDPDEWQAAIDVNLGAHVAAARALLPGWLERGRGAFLSTASAAGLLSQIGSAPYAATKHAAVAFAEWLSITYGDRGVQVACLCPMGVATPLLEQAGAAGDVVRASGGVVEPDTVAALAVDALREGRFLVLPHPEVADFERLRAGDRERWLAGMRRLRAQVMGDA